MIWFMCIDWKTINCSVGAATQHTFVIKCSLKTLTNYHLTIICHQLQGGTGGGRIMGNTGSSAGGGAGWQDIINIFSLASGYSLNIL